MLLEGGQVIDGDVLAQVGREARSFVLRNPTGKIVATWDEGRWWTPEESAEFTRQLIVEMQGESA
jgi:hypothetical protein